MILRFLIKFLHMKKFYLLYSFLFLIGCTEKTPINIDFLRSSKDHLIYYSRETNEPYTGPVFYLDNNENIFLEGDIKNGEKVGDWNYWDRYGNKIEGKVSDFSSSNFTGTVLDFYYYEDSIYVSHVSYESGNREGIYTWYLDEYDENLKSREKNIRSIKEEGTYNKGVREGSYSWEFEFGNYKGHREEGTYKNGVKEGPSVYYFLENHREERTYKNGVREGPYVRYYLSGSREEGTYKNGVIEGPYVLYFSGQWEGDREEGTYKNGVREGPFIYYESDGNINKGTYINNERKFNN